MKIYTKQGDHGQTSLMNGVSVSKSDDRIELLGTIDELSSFIGLAKVLADASLCDRLSMIQQVLMHIMAGIADPRNPKFALCSKRVAELEQQIDQMENSFSRTKGFVLYGGCELSARLDVARAVARRAERRFRSVALKYGADSKALEYMNRLSDYLYITARFTDNAANHSEKNYSSSDEQLCRDVVRNVMNCLSSEKGNEK